MNAWQLICGGSLGDQGHFHGLSPGIHLTTTSLRRGQDYGRPPRSSTEKGTRRGVTGPSVKEGRSKDDGPGGLFIPFVLLSSAQKEQYLAAYSEPQAVERRLHQTTEVPHGNPGGDHSPSSEGNVGGVHRLEGCVPSHSNCSSVSTLPRLQLPREVVQVYGPPLRPIHVPTGLYPGGRGGSSRAKKAGSYVVRVPRRLAHPRKLGRVSVGTTLNETIKPPYIH